MDKLFWWLFLVAVAVDTLRPAMATLEERNLAQPERYEEVIKDLQDSRHQSSLLYEKNKALIIQ